MLNSLKEGNIFHPFQDHRHAVRLLSRLRGILHFDFWRLLDPTACSEGLSEMLRPGQATATEPSPKENIKNIPV